MAQTYADMRIVEALRQSNGNKTKARQQLIQWAYEDPRLLRELTKSHLDGIIAYHVERAVSGKIPPPPQSMAGPQARKPAGVDMSNANPFGMALLKAAVDSDAAPFGMEAYSEPPKSGKASQQHVNAIRQIAARSAKPPRKK